MFQKFSHRYWIINKLEGVREGRRKWFNFLESIKTVLWTFSRGFVYSGRSQSKKYKRLSGGFMNLMECLTAHQFRKQSKGFSFKKFGFIGQCSAKCFASRHPWRLKRTFATPSAIEIDKSGAFNEYSRNLATPKKNYATPSLRNTAIGGRNFGRFRTQ